MAKNNDNKTNSNLPARKTSNLSNDSAGECCLSESIDAWKIQLPSVSLDRTVFPLEHRDLTEREIESENGKKKMVTTTCSEKTPSKRRDYMHSSLCWKEKDEDETNLFRIDTKNTTAE
jgi:hypothetical protein